MPPKLYSRQAGIIADLDDERFSEENGIKGYWDPFSFFKQFGGGTIYFLEKRTTTTCFPASKC
jgi:hypothetical protein